MARKVNKVARTLPNGVDVLQEDDFIWGAYRYKCVVHPRRYAVTLHEEPPKSQDPYWKFHPTQRFPLCVSCHDAVHEMSRLAATYFLYENRAKNFPKAVSQIDEITGEMK